MSMAHSAMQMSRQPKSFILSRNALAWSLYLVLVWPGLSRCVLRHSQPKPFQHYSQAIRCLL